MGIPGQERGFMISLAVLIQYMSVTDRQTDRQTQDDDLYRAMHNGVR